MPLSETLLDQQKLVHKLYMELEAEREASASAATEALSMILRLQGEKAAEKLEATQFKRMTQEKMNHAHQLEAIFEELMHHKEIEIASLQFQLHAYRCKMLRLGLSDSEIDDMEFGPGNNNGILRKIQSLPSAITLKASSPREIGNDQFDVHCNDVHKMIFDEPAASDLVSYWGQIKELDERVKALSCATAIDKREDQHDPFSSNEGFQSTGFRFHDESQGTSVGEAVIDLDNRICAVSASTSQTKQLENLLLQDHSSVPCIETNNIPSASQSISIQDIFEVPQNNDTSLSQKQEGKRMDLEEENRLGKPDAVRHGTIKYCCRDEAGCVKGSLQCVHTHSKWTKPNEGTSVTCHLALVDLENSILPFKTDFKQLNKRLEKLEGDRQIEKQGVSPHEEENLRLLREIHVQLNSMQSEIRSIKTDNCPVAEEPSLVSLMEAMFFYSL